MEEDLVEERRQEASVPWFSARGVSERAVARHRGVPLRVLKRALESRSGRCEAVTESAGNARGRAQA